MTSLGDASELRIQPVTDAAVEADNSDTFVIVGAPAGDDYTLRALELNKQLQREFTTTARQILSNATSRAIVDYHPGDNQQRGEMMTIPLQDVGPLLAIRDAVQQPTSLESFDPSHDMADHLKFYLILLKTHNSSTLLFRRFTAQNRLKSSSKIKAMLRQGSFSGIEEEVMLFDRDADGFVRGEDVYILKKHLFEADFQFREPLSEHAANVARDVTEILSIRNAEEFIEACAGYGMAAKLASIQRRGLINDIDMDVVKEVITEFDMQITVEEEDGKSQLVFDASRNRRWDILHLLDDDAVVSRMAGRRYLADGKREV